MLWNSLPSELMDNLFCVYVSFATCEFLRVEKEVGGLVGKIEVLVKVPPVGLAHTVEFDLMLVVCDNAPRELSRNRRSSIL